MCFDIDGWMWCNFGIFSCLFFEFWVVICKGVVMVVLEMVYFYVVVEVEVFEVVKGIEVGRGCYCVGLCFVCMSSYCWVILWGCVGGRWWCYVCEWRFLFVWDVFVCIDGEICYVWDFGKFLIWLVVLL